MQLCKLTRRKQLSLVLALFLLLAVPLSAAQEWTAVGATGTVNTTDLGQIGFYNGVAFMGGSGTATLRYNVTATAGLVGGTKTRFLMRYLDSDDGGGSCARVEARLFRYKISDGTVDLLLTLDSNTPPPATATPGGFRVRSLDSTAFGFDFTQYAYYVEVALSRFCTSGDARLGVLQLGRL